MGRHHHPGIARFCALILAAAAPAADGQWTDWATPQEAARQFADAVRERAEATFYNCETNTLTCWNGDHQVVTRYHQSPYYGYPPSDYTNDITTPLVYFRYVHTLNSSNLIQAGVQTNTWTNSAGAVFTTNIPTFRLDDLHSWTNCNGIAHTNSPTRIEMATNESGHTVSLGWLMYVDGVLDGLIGEAAPDAQAPFTDYTVDLDAWFSTPIATNWEWIVTGDDPPTGYWQHRADRPYEYRQDFPRMNRARIWELTGIGRTATNWMVYDRGPTYPRTYTNTWSLLGWQVGNLTTYSVETVTLDHQERYLTNGAVSYQYTYDAEGSPTNIILAQYATARAPSPYPGDYILLARGFAGAGVAGIYTGYVNLVGGESGMQQSGGPHFLSLYSPGRWAVWDHPVRWGEEAPGALFYQIQTRLDASVNDGEGCYGTADGTAAGEIGRCPAWRFTDRSALTVSGWSIRDLFNQPVSNALLDVFSASTNESACGLADQPALPEELHITVRGYYFQVPPSWDGAYQLVLTQQTVTVSAPGTYPLAYPFSDVLAITNAAGLIYPKDGVHIRVRWGDSRAAYSTRFPYYTLRVAFEERKAVLNQLRWSARFSYAEPEWYDVTWWKAWTDRLTADQVNYYPTPPEYGDQMIGELKKWNFTHHP